MSAVLSDTTPEAHAVMIELLRQAEPWRRLELLAGLNRLARDLALAGLRQRYPQATPAELERRLADLLFGPELAERAFGPYRFTEPSRGS